MPRIDGLDIHGQYQPLTDRAAVPQYPLMSVKATEGKNFTQANAREYFLWFRERKFKYRGVYHWIRSDSTALEQIDNLTRFLKSVGGLQVGELVQLDWETTPGIPAPSLALINEWLGLAEQRWPGRIIVYASDWVPNFTAWRTANPHYPLWYANYNTGSSATGGPAECRRWNAHIWQWTSGAQIPGIGTRCDANEVLVWSVLDRIAGYASQPEVVQPPPPVVQPPVVIPPVVVPPTVTTTNPPALNGDTDMAYLDLGIAGTDTWYTRMELSSDLVLTHVDSTLDPILSRLPIPAAPVSESELLALLQGGKVRTRGMSPFVSTGVAPNDSLHQAWNAALVKEVQQIKLSGGAVKIPAVTAELVLG